MESYNLLVKPSVVKELERVPKRVRARLVAKIEALAETPRPVGSQKLAGADAYRLWQSNYRVLYTIDDESRVVRVMKIGHRREVYR